MPEPDVTIYCDCAYYNLASSDVKSQVLSALRESGIEFEPVADLCRLAAERDEALGRWAKAKSIRIFACYPRAVRWLFHAAGAPLPEQGVEFINMRSGDFRFQISDFRFRIQDSKIKEKEPKPSFEIRDAPRALRQEPQGPGGDDWVPWFPVIDYDHCENCKQCLDFCLFGVYELSEADKVEVRKPANCKTNCPACARLCPACAIIFPKYNEGPINGDELDEQALQDRKSKTDLKELLGPEIFDAIRRRTKGDKRFSGYPNRQDQSAAPQGGQQKL